MRLSLVSPGKTSICQSIILLTLHYIGLQLSLGYLYSEL